jgi:hypothetical protein
MPAAPVPQLLWGQWLIFGVIFVGLVYLLGCLIYRQPYALLFFFALGGIFWIVSIFDTHHRRRLAADRNGETICEFARSFERKTDTWILRAVYEEISRYLSVDGRPLPVRRTDRCENDLRIDPEDLNDLASDVAFRAQRSLNGAEKNPLYNKVETVGDIVSFFEHQPEVVNIESGGRPIG